MNFEIVWSGPGWYASRVEGDSGMEVMMSLESRSDSQRVPSLRQSEEARQKGLGPPFWLDESPEGFEVK